jgi:hypothetical protein
MRSTFRALFTAGVVASAGVSAGAPEMQCKQGPVLKSIGGSDWNVYACDDQKSVVVTVVKATPQLPFYYFLVTPSNAGVEVVGEGSGSKSVTEPVYQALTKLKSTELAALVAEARRVGARL